jgi:hypothetical protein
MAFDFQWQVPHAGFAWVVVPEQSTGQAVNLERLSDYLVPVVPAGAALGKEDKIYHPLAVTGLFRRFTDTPTTKEGILEFANEFGRLGGGVTARISPQPGSDPGTHFWWLAESLDSWGAEIEQMKDAVHLWDLCRAGEREDLSKLIHWEDHFIYYRGRASQFVRTATKLVIASEDDSLGDPVSDYDRGDVVLPAWRALLLIVNMALKKHPATPQLCRDRKEPAPSFKSRLVPESLISAMWTQVHHAIKGNKDYERCEQCRRWFEVAAEKRKDAKYCSNACRFKAYRYRQKQAKRLHCEGMTFRQIALELNSDDETVKGWIER